MKNSIELKKIKIYDVKINGVPLGEFRVKSKWQGFRELVGESGVIIVHGSDSSFEILSSFFELGDDYKIISCSPEISKLLQESKDKNES